MGAGGEYSRPGIIKKKIIRLDLGEPSKLKMSQIGERVHNFLDPPPQDNLDYFEFGKKLIFEKKNLLDRNWEKFEM